MFPLHLKAQREPFERRAMSSALELRTPMSNDPLPHGRRTEISGRWPSVAVCPSSSPARSAAAASGGTSCRCSQPHATALPCYIMAENVQLWSGPVGRGHPTAACSFLVAFDHIFSRESAGRQR
eukprot:EG_transcript_9100